MAAPNAASGPDAGVIRLFRFRPLRVAFDGILREKMIPALLELPGLVDVYVGRQGPDELGPRLIATAWTSRAAMTAAVGDSFEKPVFLPLLLDETHDRTLEFYPLSLGYRFDRPERPGIVRVFTGTLAPTDLARYVEDARIGTLEDAEHGRGPLALYLARTAPGKFVTLSVWTDWQSLQDATGGDAAQPIATRHAGLLSTWTAEHYEAIPALWELTRRAGLPSPSS
jgi:hypothetical protein